MLHRCVAGSQEDLARLDSPAKSHMSVRLANAVSRLLGAADQSRCRPWIDLPRPFLPFQVHLPKIVESGCYGGNRGDGVGELLHTVAVASPLQRRQDREQGRAVASRLGELPSGPVHHATSVLELVLAPPSCSRERPRQNRVLYPSAAALDTRPHGSSLVLLHEAKSLGRVDVGETRRDDQNVAGLSVLGWLQRHVAVDIPDSLRLATATPDKVPRATETDGGGLRPGPGVEEPLEITTGFPVLDGNLCGQDLAEDAGDLAWPSVLSRPVKQIEGEGRSCQIVLESLDTVALLARLASLLGCALLRLLLFLRLAPGGVHPLALLRPG